MSKPPTKEPSETLTEVVIVTDGSCKPNPGPGGWAAILRSGSRKMEIWGSAEHTTNNRMEMIAIIEGLRALKRRASVTVHTDSTICVGVLNGTGRKAHKRKNQDLVQQMLEERNKHVVRAEWIKGHAGHEDNERCDRLAEQARAKIVPF